MHIQRIMLSMVHEILILLFNYICTFSDIIKSIMRMNLSKTLKELNIYTLKFYTSDPNVKFIRLV